MKISDIKENGTVFVRNKTKCDVNITLTDEKGNPLLIIIYRTPIPQDITEIATAKMLKEDIGFKKLLVNGTLELIEENKAIEELQGTESQLLLAELSRKKQSLPKELEANYNENISPTEAVSSGLDDTEIRGEIRDIAIDETIPDEDAHARLVLLNKEESISRLELDFLLSSLNDSLYFNSIEYLKGLKAVSNINKLSN